VNRFTSGYGRRIWRAVRDFIGSREHIDSRQSGRVLVRLEKERGGDGEVLRVRAAFVSTPTSKWTKTPVLAMDATLPVMPILQEFFPDIVQTLTAEVDAPYERIRYVPNAPTTLTKLGDINHLTKLASYTCTRSALMGNARTLLITNRAAAAQLTDMVGSNVEVVSFGNTAVIERWGDVGLLIVAGRPEPGPTVAEDRAACLQENPIEQLANGGGKFMRWYDKREKPLLRRDGESFPVQCDAHTHDLAEAFRWLTADAAIIQAVGRGRGVNRDSEAPLQVDILSSALVHCMADEIVIWNAAENAPTYQMPVAGVVPLTGDTAMQVFPELFNTSTRSFYSRRKFAECNLGRLLSTGLYTRTAGRAVRGRFRAGVGRWCDFLWYLDKCPDPQAFLAERLGQLVELDFTRHGDRPDAVIRMAKAGFIPIEKRLDVLSCRGDIFTTEEAVRWALANWSPELRPGETLVKYKPHGRGQGWRKGIAAPGVNPQQWLESRLQAPVTVETLPEGTLTRETANTDQKPLLSPWRQQQSSNGIQTQKYRL